MIDCVIHRFCLPTLIQWFKAAMLADCNVKCDGGEHFMYRHPILNQENWNCKPIWKRFKVWSRKQALCSIHVGWKTS